MSARMSPNQREILSAISTLTGKQEYLTSTNGMLNSTATLAVESIEIGTVDQGKAGTQAWLVTDSIAESSLATIASDLTNGNQVTSISNFPSTQTISGTVTANQGTNPWITMESTGLVPKIYDSLTYTNTSSTIDTYKYYTGGVSGTLVATLTLTWTDATKTILVSVVRT